MAENYHLRTHLTHNHPREHTPSLHRGHTPSRPWVHTPSRWLVLTPPLCLSQFRVDHLTRVRALELDLRPTSLLLHPVPCRTWRKWQLAKDKLSPLLKTEQTGSLEVPGVG